MVWSQGYTMIPFHLHEHQDGQVVGSEAPRSRAHVCEIARQFGITAMITLTEKFRDYRLSDVRQHHVPVAGCPTLEEIVRVVGIAAGAMDRGGTVWIHCSQGIDRTGVMIAAVLVRRGVSVEQALSEVESTFPAHRQQHEYASLWQPYREVVRCYARSIAK